MRQISLSPLRSLCARKAIRIENIALELFINHFNRFRVKYCCRAESRRWERARKREWNATCEHAEDFYRSWQRDNRRNPAKSSLVWWDCVSLCVLVKIRMWNNVLLPPLMPLWNDDPMLDASSASANQLILLGLRLTLWHDKKCLVAAVMVVWHYTLNVIWLWNRKSQDGGESKIPTVTFWRIFKPKRRSCNSVFMSFRSPKNRSTVFHSIIWPFFLYLLIYSCHVFLLRFFSFRIYGIKLCRNLFLAARKWEAVHSIPNTRYNCETCWTIRGLNISTAYVNIKIASRVHLDEDYGDGWTAIEWVKR